MWHTADQNMKAPVICCKCKRQTTTKKAHDTKANAYCTRKDNIPARKTKIGQMNGDKRERERERERESVRKRLKKLGVSLAISHENIS